MDSLLRKPDTHRPPAVVTLCRAGRAPPDGVWAVVMFGQGKYEARVGQYWETTWPAMMTPGDEWLSFVSLIARQRRRVG